MGFPLAVKLGRFKFLLFFYEPEIKTDKLTVSSNILPTAPNEVIDLTILELRYYYKNHF